jgi:hypothetical protein
MGNYKNSSSSKKSSKSSTDCKESKCEPRTPALCNSERGCVAFLDNEITLGTGIMIGPVITKDLELGVLFVDGTSITTFGSTCNDYSLVARKGMQGGTCFSALGPSQEEGEGADGLDGEEDTTSQLGDPDIKKKNTKTLQNTLHGISNSAFADTCGDLTINLVVPRACGNTKFIGFYDAPIASGISDKRGGFCASSRYIPVNPCVDGFGFETHMNNTDLTLAILQPHCKKGKGGFFEFNRTSKKRTINFQSLLDLEESGGDLFAKRTTSGKQNYKGIFTPTTDSGKSILESVQKLTGALPGSFGFSLLLTQDNTKWDTFLNIGYFGDASDGSEVDLAFGLKNKCKGILSEICWEIGIGGLVDIILDPGSLLDSITNFGSGLVNQEPVDAPDSAGPLAWVGHFKLDIPKILGFYTPGLNIDLLKVDRDISAVIHVDYTANVDVSSKCLK